MSNAEINLADLFSSAGQPRQPREGHPSHSFSLTLNLDYQYPPSPPSPDREFQNLSTGMAGNTTQHEYACSPPISSMVYQASQQQGSSNMDKPQQSPLPSQQEAYRSAQANTPVQGDQVHTHDSRGFPLMADYESRSILRSGQESPIFTLPANSNTTPRLQKMSISHGNIAKTPQQQVRTNRETESIYAMDVPATPVTKAPELSARKAALLASMTQGMKQSCVTTDRPASDKNNKRSVSFEDDTPTKRQATISTKTTETLTKRTPASRTGRSVRRTSTNKKDAPTEAPTVSVNSGSAFLTGPFDAYPKEMSVPESTFDDEYRKNPYLQNVTPQKPLPLPFKPKVNRPAAPVDSTTPVLVRDNSSRHPCPAMSFSTQAPIITAPAHVEPPTVEELRELRDHLEKNFDRLVNHARSIGIVLSGRERDKLFNRTARVPNMVIEVRLKGIDGFKDECKAWDTAMEEMTILKRRDFFRDKVIQVDKMIAKIQGEPETTPEDQVEEDSREEDD